MLLRRAGAATVIASSLLVGPGTILRAQDTTPSQTKPVAGADPVYPANAARVVPPRKIKNVAPRYTAEAMRNRIEGTVRLRGIVERDGSISSVEVVQSLDSVYGLDDEAIKAVKQWQFEPATLDGNPIRVVVTVDMKFTVGSPPAIWPDGVTVPPLLFTATPEEFEPDHMRLAIARPESWVAQPADHSKEWLSWRRRDTDASFRIALPEEPTILTGIATYVPDSITLASGQTQSQAGMQWVWSTLRVPGAEGERRLWRFATLVDRRMIMVTGSMVIPRELDAAAAAALVKQVSSDIVSIVNSLLIEKTPG